MKIVFHELAPYPKWWTNYIMSFNDSVQFQNECNKLGIKFVGYENGTQWKEYEVHFPDERTFTMMVLKWS